MNESSTQAKTEMNAYFFCRSCGRLSTEDEMIFPDHSSESICPHCQSADNYAVRIVRADYRRSLALALLEVSVWFGVLALALIGVCYLISQW